MGARTGAEYLKGLAATKREIWLGGEMVDDVVVHPEFTQGAHAIAEWYDRQFAYADELLIPDPDDPGERMNISHMQPRSKEDLKRRHVGLRRIAEMSIGTMGRTPDYMNVTFAGFADNPTDWRGADGSNEEGCQNIIDFQKRLRSDDLSLTHTIVHPVVDKVKDSQFAGNPVPVHKVGETADGIIVRGGRLLATLAPFADEQTVYPGDPLPPDAPDEYALAFTVRMDAPGLIFLCRDSAAQPHADPFDAPFGTRFDEQDAYCIFDDVEVPRENVWIDGNKDVYNSVMMPSSWWPNIMQQTTIRALTKLEFAYGLATRMTEIINDHSPRTHEMLGEILSYVEATRNAVLIAEENCTTWPDGGVYPEARAMHPMRSILPTWFTRVNEIMKTLGSHNFLAVASRGQLDDDRLRPLIDEFLTGAEDHDAEERSAIYRLAWDFVGTTIGGRNELYERNYLSSSKTNRIAAHNRYSAAARARGNELIDHMLASATARS
ncbi:MAG: 4-hydroxyphenylacetate 3-hydroxylase N-terminal domain-containing protein [Actinomycetota bacterium]|jgi:4-hydroxyphenylacetate 3-monooxygenase|nr:4-hydroxyphenylacetate 3-hydroxylase N-terminal domain-containing protein [Actinomycetota bacterium]